VVTNSPTSTFRSSTVAGTGERMTVLSESIVAIFNAPSIWRTVRSLGVDLLLARAELGELKLLLLPVKLRFFRSHHRIGVVDSAAWKRNGFPQGL